ncbi:pentatricopeptide repeat-containing protein At5g66520-like [Papaver somniferum]|uniref:pentatricopeptide repeat-containing protein At5g66520-like n=1 Tax=Papaver somniferum TaxID=3469 RepID=UPI000E700B5F|nr:pentatricopeptide repeat-containing protein At5g66520-like [Papaver somniferum]
MRRIERSMMQKIHGLKDLKQIHATIVKTSIPHDCSFQLSKLIELSALSCNRGCFLYAHKLLSQIQNPNLFLYNTMIRGSLINKQSNEATLLYMQMRKQNILPNNFTFPFVLRAFGEQFELKRGEEVHGCILKTGFGSNLFVLTTLLNMYSLCGRNSRAFTQVFDEMPVKDVVSWNSMISGHLRHGELDLARKLFERMPERDVVSWTLVIDGYVKNGHHDRSLSLFHQMQLVGVEPSVITLISVLTACANLGALELGRWIHCYIEKRKLKIDNKLGTALIDMYAKCGDIGKGLEVFSSLECGKDVITWTSVIVGLAMNGKCREALDFFTCMVMEGIKPDEITFLGVLCACSHQGFVNEGRQYFDSMMKDYHLMPRIENYSCMIDLFGRAGLLEEAKDLVENMPFQADSVILGSLFAACQTHKNVELGEQVMKLLVEIEPENKGNYVILSNIYAVAGRWENVAQVRKKLKEKGTRRVPGCSSIEVDYQVHEFLSGDRSHSRSMEIFEMLDLLRGYDK